MPGCVLVFFGKLMLWGRAKFVSTLDVRIGVRTFMMVVSNIIQSYDPLGHDILFSVVL